MEIKIKQKKNTKTIKIIGDINLTELEKVETTLKGIKDFSEIQIDLSKVTYTNSSFLNIIIMVKDKYPDKKIIILNPNELVMQLLTLTGIEHLVDIRTTD